jgi:hypothetical protein
LGGKSATDMGRVFLWRQKCYLFWVVLPWLIMHFCLCEDCHLIGALLAWLEYCYPGGSSATLMGGVNLLRGMRATLYSRSSAILIRGVLFWLEECYPCWEQCYPDGRSTNLVVAVTTFEG